MARSDLGVLSHKSHKTAELAKILLMQWWERSKSSVPSLSPHGLANGLYDMLCLIHPEYLCHSNLPIHFILLSSLVDWGAGDLREHGRGHQRSTLYGHIILYSCKGLHRVLGKALKVHQNHLETNRIHTSLKVTHLYWSTTPAGRMQWAQLYHPPYLILPVVPHPLVAWILLSRESQCVVGRKDYATNVDEDNWQD